MPFPDPNNNNNIFTAPIPEINNGFLPQDKTPEIPTEKPQDIFDGAFSDLKPEGVITDTPFDTERYDKGESLILGESQNVLENVYAERQGFLTQLANGVIKTIPNAVGSFVGSFTAIPELLSGAEYGSTTGFADSWLKSWENRFPNYKTSYEQENPMKSWINPIYWGNKLGDGLIKNIGFTIGTIGGMIVQDAIIGTATEGIGAVPLVTAQLGKLANSVGRLFATGEKLDKLVDVARTQKSMYDAVRNLSTGAKITSLAQYGLLSATAAMSEAGMEAYHVNEDTKKSLIDQLKAAKGEVTAEDMAEIDKLAKEAATTTYGWNLPVILASNAIMLGDFFSNKGVSNLTKEVLENTTLQGGKWSANMLSKGAKMVQYSKNFAVPFMTEGFWEEGNQHIISEYTKHRAESKFKGQSPKELTDFYLSQMLTPEYQESVFIGGLTGLTMSGGGALYNKVKGNSFSDQQRKVLEGLNQNDSFTNNVKMFAEAVTNKGHKELAPNIFAEKNEQVLNMASNVANLKRTGRYEAFRDRLDALKEMPTEELDKLGVTLEDVENIGQKLDSINELYTGIDKLRNPIQNPTQAQKIAFEYYKDAVLQQTSLFDSFKGRTETLRSELTDHFEFDILDALIAKDNKEGLITAIENKIESLKLQLEGFRALNPNSKEVADTKDKIDSLTKILRKSNFRDAESTKESVLRPLLENSPYFTKLVEANQEEFLNNVYEKLNDLKKLSINSKKLDKQDALEFINMLAPVIEERQKNEITPVTPEESPITETKPTPEVSTVTTQESKETPKETTKETKDDSKSKTAAFESMFGITEEETTPEVTTPEVKEEVKPKKTYNKVVQKVLDKINNGIVKNIVLSDDKTEYIEKENPENIYARVSDLKPEYTGVNNREGADRGTVADDLLRAFVNGITTLEEFTAFYNKTDKGESKKFNASFIKDLFDIYTEFVASNDYELISDAKVLYGVLEGKQYAGTIDLLAIHKTTGEVKIIDLKTSSQDRTDQTNDLYLGYRTGDTIQLNAYRTLLEQLTGIKASIAIFPIQVFSDYKGYNSAVKSDPNFIYELDINEPEEVVETKETKEEKENEDVTTIQDDLDAKKADIERKRQGLNGVEEIIFSNPNFRLEGFEIDGNYWNVITSTDRAKVLVNINGVIVPFYLTTGQAGKGLVPGWYPFFGIGKDGWLNKTDKSDMETYYERYWGKEAADIVKSISEELNSFYGTDPSVFKNDGDPNATSRPLSTLADKVEDYINSKLSYTPAMNNADARKTLRSNVEQLGKEINAKYDAELKAVEQVKPVEQPAAQNLDEPAEFNPTSEETLEELAEEEDDEIAPEEDFFANRVSYLAVDKVAEPGERYVDPNYAKNYEIIHSVKEGNELRFKLREGKTLDDLNGWVAYNEKTDQEYVTTDRNDPELVIDIYYKNTRLGAMPRNAKKELSPQRFVVEQRNIDAQRTKVLGYLLDNKEVKANVTKMNRPRLVTNKVHGVTKDFFSDINIVSKETNIESIIHKGKSKIGFGSVFINIPVLEFGETKDISVALASARFYDETLINKLYESLFTKLEDGLGIEDFVFMNKGRGIDKKGDVLYLQNFSDETLINKIQAVTKENNFAKYIQVGEDILVGFDFSKLPAELKEVIRPYFVAGMKGRYFNFNKKKKSVEAYQDFIVDYELLKTYLDPFKTGSTVRWSNHPDIHFNDPQVVEVDIKKDLTQKDISLAKIEEERKQELEKVGYTEREDRKYYKRSDGEVLGLLDIVTDGRSGGYMVLIDKNGRSYSFKDTNSKDFIGRTITKTEEKAFLFDPYTRNVGITHPSFGNESYLVKGEKIEKVVRLINEKYDEKIKNQIETTNNKQKRKPAPTGEIKEDLKGNLPVLTKTKLQTILESKFGVDYQDLNTFKDSMRYWIQKEMTWYKYNEDEDKIDSFSQQVNNAKEIKEVLAKIIAYNKEESELEASTPEEIEYIKTYEKRNKILTQLLPFVDEFYAELSKVESAAFEYEEDQDVTNLSGLTSEANVRSQFDENANFQENHYSSLPEEIRLFLSTLPKVKAIENGSVEFYTNSLGFKQLINPYDVFDKILSTMSNIQIEKDLTADLKNTITEELSKHPSLDLQFIGAYLKNQNITNEFWSKLLNVTQSYKANYVQAFVDKESGISVYSSSKTQGIGNLVEGLLSSYKMGAEFNVFNSRGELVELSPTKIKGLIDDFAKMGNMNEKALKSEFQKLKIFERLGLQNDNPVIAKRIEDDFFVNKIKAGGNNQFLAVHFVKVFKGQLELLYENYAKYEKSEDSAENEKTLNALIEEFSPFVSEPKVIKELAEINYAHSNTQETGVVRSGGKNYYPYIKPSYKTRLMKAFSNIKVGLGLQHRMFKDWGNDAIKGATLIARNIKNSLYLDKFTHEYTLGAVTAESDSLPMKQLTDTDRLVIELALYVGNQTNPRLLHDTNEAKPIFELTQMFDGNYVINNLTAQNDVVKPVLDSLLLSEYIVKLYAENARIINTHNISKKALTDKALAKLLMPGIHNTVSYVNDSMVVKEGNATRHIIFPFMSREMLDDMSKGDDLYAALRDFIYRKTVNVDNTLEEQYSELVWQPIDLLQYRQEKVFGEITLEQGIKQLLQEDFRRDLDKNKNEFIAEGIFSGETFEPKVFERLFSKKSYGRKLMNANIANASNIKTELSNIAEGKYSTETYERAKDKTLGKAMKILSSYFLLEYTAYTRLHSLEMLMMTGDPGLFNKGNLNAYNKNLVEKENVIANYVKTYGAVSVELAKRNASLNASGMEGTMYWPNKQTTIIKAADFKVNSPLYETISTLIGKGAAKSYMSGDKTDAMKISTIKSVLEKEFIQGTLTENEFLNLFQQLAPEHYERTVQKNPSYFKMLLGNYKENDLNKGLKKVLEYKHGKYLYTKAFNPIKNVGRGHAFDPKLNAIFEHYVKDADLPITRNTVGGQFNELIKYLEDNDIDSIVFDTAVKQLKTKPVELFVKKDLDGTEVEVLNTEALKDTITLPFDSFRQQLATPFEQSKSKVAESTQQIAILVADMPFDYPIGGNTKTFKEEYFKVHQDLFMDSLSSLSDDMGIRFKYDQESGSLEMEFENLEKLSKYLIRQVKLQNLDDSLTDALQLTSDGKFKVPLTYTIGNKSLQPVILSEFTKHAVKKKIHGKPYFQATEGILQTIRTLEDFEYEKDGVKYSGADFKVSDATKASMKTTKEFAQGDGKLKGLRLVKDGVETDDQALIQKYKDALDTLENNDLLYSTKETYPAVKAKRDAAIKFISEFEVRPMEIILGFNFLDENGFRLNLEDFLDEEGYIDETKIDPKLLEVNGFRIPYQGKSSGGWFKIVGFLPHHNADTAIVAAEIVAQMGSDFDIDKLYTYAYNYILVDGKLKLYNEENVAAYNKIQDDKKKEELEIYKDAKDLWEKYLVFDKNDHPATLATLEVFEQVIENKYDFDTFDEINNSSNTYSSLFKFLKKQGILKSRKEFENKKGLQNNLLDLHKKVYLSPFYYRDIIRPLETPNSDTAIEFLEEAKRKNVTGYKVNNIYNRATQRAILKDNVLGQTALGVFVTNSLIHTVFQETGAYFQYPLLIKKGGKILRDSEGYKQTMFSDLTGDEEIIYTTENAVKDGKVQYESLDGLRRIDRLFTLDGNVKVSTVYNEAIGISVDNPKDKKLAKLGINNENMNIYANLIRMLPVEDVVTLLNQPILEQFFKKVESFNSMFYDEFQKDKVTEAARKILEDTIKQFGLGYKVSNENPIIFKFKQGEDFVTPYIDLNALEKSIGGQITAENAENQIFLLSQMFLFREQSNNVRDMIGKMDTYRNGLKGTFVENKQVADKVEDLFVGTLVKNVSRNFNKTIPSITIKVPQAVNALFSNGIFAYGSFGYDYMYNTIGGQSKFRVDLGNEEFSHKLSTNELNQINNEFQRYLMTNPEITKRLLDLNGLQLISNLGAEYVYDETMDYATSVDDFLFNGKDSVYNLIKEVKAKGSNFDNMFALKLEVKNKKNNGIEIKSINRDLYDRIKKDWLRLLSSDTNSAEFKLGHKLLIYAFLYGNKQYGTTSLLRYMPAEVLESIGYGEIMNQINDKFDSAQSIHFINPFVESYIKNNPDILTKIPFKELKFNGQYVKMEDKRLEKKDYFYTVNYDKKTNRPYKVLYKRVDKNLFEKIDQLDFYKFGAVAEKTERMSSDKRYEQYFKVESYIPANHTILVDDLIKNITSLSYEEDRYIKGMLESMRPALSRIPNYKEMTINFGKQSSYNPKTKTITVQHDQKIPKVLVDIVHELSHALMEEEITKQEKAEVKSQEYLDVMAAYSQFRKNIVNMRGQDDISKINFADIEEALFKTISEKGTDPALLNKFLNGTELDNSFSTELKKIVDVSLPATRLEVIKAELKTRGITADLLNTLYYPYGDLHEFVGRVFDGTLIPTLLDKEMVQSENAKGLFNRLMKSIGKLFTHLKKFFTSISGVSAANMKNYETSLAKEAVVSIFNFSKLVDADMYYDTNFDMRENYEVAYKKYFGEVKAKEEKKVEVKEIIKENKPTISEIYDKLGNKTASGNVVIKSVYQQEGVKYAKSIGGVFSLRINDTDKHFGNPFSSVKKEIEKGLIATKSTKESVEKYIDWILNSKEVKGINIFSKSTESLGKRLTNPNWYAKDLMDVEAPYKANSSKIKAPQLNAEEALKYDMNLMYSLQIQKFRKNPELIDEINQVGGLDFIKQSSHIVGVKNSRWEGKGMESNFIKVLAKSYETVAKELDKFKETSELEPQRREWIREQLKSGILKGKPVVYWKELGQPSHATALDYLINKYDWDKQRSNTVEQNVEVVSRYSNVDLKANPNKIYVFGDNTQRIGTGGQAQIRNNSNAFGIATKLKPTMNVDAFMTDNDLESNKQIIDSDIAKIKAQNKTVVLPKDGFGTGLAKLKEKAPKTYEYLKQRLLQEFGFNNDTGEVVKQSETKDVEQGNNPAEQIYSQLGDKTQSQHVALPEELGLKYNGKNFWNEIVPEAKAYWENASHPILIAFRGNKSKSFLENYKNNTLGNPFDWQKYEEIEATKMFIDWIITGNNYNESNATPEFRNQLISDFKSGKWKGNTILYYEELKRPSHATALDYLINKYDWNQEQEVKPVIQDTRNIDDINLLLSGETIYDQKQILSVTPSQESFKKLMCK